MNAIKGIFRAGHLVMESPPDWPDGTEVLIEPTWAPEWRIGLDESQWSDNPDALKDWEAWINTIEPLELTDEETARMSEFDQAMRRFNLEAVSREMQRGTPE